MRLVFCTPVRWVVASVLLALAPDATRGRMLYENHCVVCHTVKVHRRNPPLAIDRQELRRIVGEWAREAKAHWGAAEIEDVTHYLDTTHYRPVPR